MCPSWRPGAANQDTVFPSVQVQVCRKIPAEQLTAPRQLSDFFSKPEHATTGKRGYLAKFGSVADRWQR